MFLASVSLWFTQYHPKISRPFQGAPAIGITVFSARGSAFWKTTGGAVDRTLESWLIRGIIPKMAELFRLVNYCNLPRFLRNNHEISWIYWDDQLLIFIHIFLVIIEMINHWWSLMMEFDHKNDCNVTSRPWDSPNFPLKSTSWDGVWMQPI